MVNNYLSPASQPWVRDIENKINTALNTAQSAGKSVGAIFPTRTVNLNDGKITLTAPGALQPATIGSAIESNVVNFTLPDVMPDDYYLRVNTTVVGGDGTYHIDLGTTEGVMEITEEAIVAPGEDIEEEVTSDATHVIRLPYITVAEEDVQADAEPEYEEITDPESGEVTLQPKDNHTTQVDLPKNGTIAFVASDPGTRFVNTTVDVVPVNAGSVVIDVASEEPTIKIIDALGYERDINDAIDGLEVSFNEIHQTINDEAIAAQAKIQEVLTALDAEERARIEADEENRRIFEAFDTDQEQLTEILTSVNSKNSTTVSTEEPSTATPGTVPGDTWWRVDSSNRVFGQWTWDGSAWVSSTIREEMIASLGVHQLQVTGTAGIQTAVIDRLYNDIIITKLLKATEIITGSMLAEGTITGDKVVANTLTGDKLLANSVGAREIAAKSISAEKLVIAPGNMFPDPNMQDVDNWSGSLTKTTVNGVERSTANIGGLNATYNVPIQGMEPEKQYKVSLYVLRSSNTTETIYSSIKATKSPTGSTLPTTTTKSPSVEVRHPEGTLNSYFWVDTLITVPSGEEFEYALTVRATATTRLAGVKIVPMTDASLIVDGSITSNLLSADAIDGKTITGVTITGGTITGGVLKLVTRDTDFGYDIPLAAWKPAENVYSLISHESLLRFSKTSGRNPAIITPTYLSQPQEGMDLYVEFSAPAGELVSFVFGNYRATYEVGAREANTPLIKVLKLTPFSNNTNYETFISSEAPATRVEGPTITRMMFVSPNLNIGAGIDRDANMYPRVYSEGNSRTAYMSSGQFGITTGNISLNTSKANNVYARESGLFTYIRFNNSTVSRDSNGTCTLPFPPNMMLPTAPVHGFLKGSDTVYYPIDVSTSNIVIRGLTSPQKTLSGSIMFPTF